MQYFHLVFFDNGIASYKNMTNVSFEDVSLYEEIKSVVGCGTLFLMNIFNEYS